MAGPSRGDRPDRIPNPGQAEVSLRKLTDYLLSPAHPIGSSKAQFFLRLGFRQDDPERLRAALVRHARDSPVLARESTGFGSKYLIDGPLEGPAGRAEVRSVWFFDEGSRSARFVTAYPAPRRRR